MKINHLGEVVSAEVKQSSGRPRLDAAAVAGVLAMRCLPLSSDPKFVVTVDKSINFFLND